MSDDDHRDDAEGDGEQRDFEWTEGPGEPTPADDQPSVGAEDAPDVGHDVTAESSTPPGDRLPGDGDADAMASTDAGADHAPGGDGGDRDAPLGGLADEVADRRQRGDDDFDDLFSEESVGEVDRETLWQQVADDGSSSGPEAPSGRELRVVRKASYCQGCPHLTDPPRLACTHEGTEIVEVVDDEQFLVADCPVVREDEELGDIENVTRPEAYEGTLDSLPNAGDRTPR